MIRHSPTRLNGLGSDGQVDCKWVGYRDLEDGVSLDSQHVGGYLEHALGKAQDSAKNGSQMEKACQDRVRTYVALSHNCIPELMRKPSGICGGLS